MTALVTTAVFPVAGRGTRFAPVTRATPKELLPILERPVLHYAVAEAKAAGIQRFVFVTAQGKEAIAAYFAAAADPALPDSESLIYLHQRQPLGLGHAVWCARAVVGGAPFAVLCPDDLILASPPCLAQLMAAHADRGGAALAVMEAPRADLGRYGVLDTADATPTVVTVRGLVEKPRPEEAPSSLAIVGRYILPSAVWEPLSEQRCGIGGEIQLTDAIAALIGRTPVHGVRFEGTRFDCGVPAGWLAANLAVAATRPDLVVAARPWAQRLADAP